MIYDQSQTQNKEKGTCGFYAVLGAIVDRYKLDTPQEKLEAYIDASGRRFAGIPWILEHLKTHPFEGYKAVHRDIFYNSRLPHAHMDAPKSAQFKNLVRFNEKLIIVLVKTHKTDKKPYSLDLSLNNFLISYPGLLNIFDHAVYVRGIQNGKMGPTYTLVNSWGDDWGNQGEFYIKPDHLYSEVSAIYTFDIEKVDEEAPEPEPIGFMGHSLTNAFRSKTPKGFYDSVKGHTGCDYLMPVGTPLSLPVPLKFVDVFQGRETGLNAVLEDRGGSILVFSHCSSIKSKRGDILLPNTVFALSGNSGSKTTAPHVHFEIIAKKPATGLEFMTRSFAGFDGYNIDPSVYLKKIYNITKV